MNKKSGNTLSAGDILLPGDYLASDGNFYYLAFAADGDLCVFLGTPDRLDQVAWRANYQFIGPQFAIMQADGNLCVYQGTPDKQGALLWQSATAGQPRFGIMQDDANFCIYDEPKNPHGDFIWGSAQNGGVATGIGPAPQPINYPVFINNRSGGDVNFFVKWAAFQSPTTEWVRGGDTVQIDFTSFPPVGTSCWIYATWVGGGDFEHLESGDNFEILSQPKRVEYDFNSKDWSHPLSPFFSRKM